MSEPKLCPFFYGKMVDRWVTAYHLYVSETRPMPGRITEDRKLGIGICLREQCAMWRILSEDIGDIPGDVALSAINAQRVMAGYEPLDKSPGECGYCGLAGKP